MNTTGTRIQRAAATEKSWSVEGLVREESASEVRLRQNGISSSASGRAAANALDIGATW